jgi:hypothetical protein
MMKPRYVIVLFFGALAARGFSFLSSSFSPLKYNYAEETDVFSSRSPSLSISAGVTVKLLPF